MKNIRIGKDIVIKWTILTNNERIDLEGRKLSFSLVRPGKKYIPLPFTIEGNTLISRFKGVEQKALGKYSLILWENPDDIGQTALDACDAFSLVSTTCEECGSDEPNLNTVMLELSGNMCVGFTGPSAYEIAVKKGFIGTEDEWLESLKGQKGDDGLSGNINYPTFYVNERMHLVMRTNIASDEDRFRLKKGHLIMKL